MKASPATMSAFKPEPASIFMADSREDEFHKHMILIKGGVFDMGDTFGDP